jgi:hypothetical protein
MRRITASIGASMILAGAIAWSAPARGSAPPAPGTPCATLDPALFVSIIDNPYYPLPVGRTLVYRGVKDGQTQVDRVRVSSETKLIGGVTATVVRDVARHGTKVLEATTDWFAQDVDGNVCYLGEETKHFGPNGQVDTSGSWEAGADGAVAGIVMLADPQVPDAYRQEYYVGQAEDTAWITNTSGSITVPYGTVRDVVTSLETSVLEPDVIDQKVYAPGLGIVLERAIAGDVEFGRLVRVTG